MRWNQIARRLGHGELQWFADSGDDGAVGTTRIIVDE